MKKLGALILFLAVVSAVAGSRLLRLNNPEAIHVDKTKHLYLEEKADFSRLSYLLTDSLQVAGNEEELAWAANILGWRTFQPGHYQISEGYSYNEFLSKLAKGLQDPISLTIVPGQSKSRILSFLANRMRFDSAAVHAALQDTGFLKSNRVPPDKLIGYLFPATYDLYWTQTARQTFGRIFGEFDRQVIEQYRSRANELDMTMNEVLSLAAIIEWEAIHNDEKPMISGLYWNRLERGMLLQADPTVNYAVKEKRRLYYKDYKVNHPYNTYIHKGLPPGPITNPSLSSIHAALYPEDHDYIFMVARPNGYHAFSKTYAEHQRKSAEWRQYLREQSRK